jgi:cellulose synthase/poly-beta-1,6-N-acetylglucosamine synthase-like glycosyltransferase
MENILLIGYIFIGYALLYTSSKIIISLYSLYQVKLFYKKYNNVDLNTKDLDMPKVTIIAPAYNEGVLILDTSKTYLEQNYPNFEVIISSDGGTDDTLLQLIKYYDLYKVRLSSFKKSKNIKHEKIKKVFKSRKYSNLIVIDKVNGGKSDAQNAGISISSGEIITIIDADSILDTNALTKLVNILKNEKDVIGIGSPIGILNDNDIHDINNKNVTVPKTIWGKIQVLEYLRSFLLGRMGLQKIYGLALVSGAFGVYRKQIIEDIGGYSNGSLAEDMDVDCKIWRHIKDNDLKVKIKYIPEVFCWSEVPNNFKNLKSQRDRWSRGLTETIWKNKDLFLNPKKGLLGLFTFPYYVFFEWLTPIIEIIGLIIFPILILTGKFELSHLFYYTLIMYYVIGVITNLVTIYAETITNKYYNKKSLMKLSLLSLVEPIFYHWINSMLYVYGNVRLLFGIKGWGKMDRSGIKKSNV